MGCAHVKAARIEGVTFGEDPGVESEKARAKLNCVQAAASYKGVDPKLGLTEREVFKLKTSWKAVHRRVADAGVEMFISLFKSSRELQAMFLKFSKLELSDNIRENGDLAVHGELVMGILDDAIMNIENIQPMKDRIARAAVTHRKFAGFYGKLFWAMEQPFLDAVRLTLEDRFNENIAQIYAKTIRYILQEMEEAFEQQPE